MIEAIRSYNTSKRRRSLVYLAEIEKNSSHKVFKPTEDSKRDVNELNSVS